jgi:hypothetical protein
MTAKQHFFLYFFLIIAVPTFAQITKNSKTIGSANLGFQSNVRYYTSNTRIPSEYDEYALGFGIRSPYYMVSDNLQVGLGLGFNSFFENSSPNMQIFRSIEVSFQPEINYYFKKKMNGFYVNLGGKYGYYDEIRRGVTPPNEPTAYKSSNYAYHVGVGVILPVNENIFMDGQVGYFNRELGRGFYDNTVEINVGLKNFVPQIFGNKSKDSTQFIKAGRSIVSSRFFVRHSVQGNSYTLLNGFFERFKFKNNHFALGYYGGATIGVLPDRDDFYNFSVGTKARYYVPMFNRWYIYPELGLGLDFNTRNLALQVEIMFSKKVGFNYFITPYVAIDANIDFDFSFHKTESMQQKSKVSDSKLVFNLGVTYFIDKLF